MPGRWEAFGWMSHRSRRVNTLNSLMAEFYSVSLECHRSPLESVQSTSYFAEHLEYLWRYRAS